MAAARQGGNDEGKMINAQRLSFIILIANLKLP